MLMAWEILSSTKDADVEFELLNLKGRGISALMRSEKEVFSFSLSLVEIIAKRKTLGSIYDFGSQIYLVQHNFL